MEGTKIIGLQLDGQSVTLEPGGQFELSGATVESLHQTCAEVNQHLYQVRSVSEELGLGFLGAGFDPKWKYEDVPRQRKGEKLLKMVFLKFYFYPAFNFYLFIIMVLKQQHIKQSRIS